MVEAELLFIGCASGLFRAHQTPKTGRPTPCKRTQRCTSVLFFDFYFNLQAFIG